MPSVSFTLPFSKLRAAALFASTDESRIAINGVHVEQPQPGKILIVATDGRRLAVIRHELDEPVESFADFTIPLGLIRQADPTGTIRAYNDLANELGFGDHSDWPGDLNEDAPVRVTFDGQNISIAATAGSVVTFTAKCLTFGGGLFPKWRQVLSPITGPVNHRVAVQGRFIAEFGKAAHILNQNTGTIVTTGYGTQTNDCDNAAIVAIRFTGTPGFFGVLMPVRIDAKAVAMIPEWLA